LLVCDEAHRLKSAGGNQTIAALQGCPARRRVLLTGTPIQNDLGEFFAMVDFCCPGALGSDVRAFQRLYQQPIERGTDKTASQAERALGEARAAELQRATAAFVLRRTAEVNDDFLPPRTDVSVFFRLSDRQAEQYQAAASALLRAAPATSAGTDALKLVHRLRQICTHAALLGPEEHLEQQQEPEVDLSASASVKLVIVAQLVARMRAACEQDRVVLVTNSTRTLWRRCCVAGAMRSCVVTARRPPQSAPRWSVASTRRRVRTRRNPPIHQQQPSVR
jgi:DNA repair and recombination protein RAD54B